MESMTVCYTPSSDARKAIQAKTRANASLCWSCSACDSECPVFLGSSRLRPQKVLRMANLGLLDELVGLPEIWYCLACKRCTRSCPNDCEPETVVGFLRKEAIRADLYSEEALSHYEEFYTRFQRVRWRATEQCLKGDEMASISPSQWQAWLETPIEISTEDVSLSELSPSEGFMEEADRSATASCFNCSECTNACPICFERKVFDPQWIFRMVNLGLEREILKSPSIWLCIACQTCTAACSQLVSGHDMIRRLQELAVKEGMVDPGFPLRWRKTQSLLYPLFTRQIDSIFGFQAIALASNQ
jgi:heterodisulfide reductase subunit C